MAERPKGRVERDVNSLAELRLSEETLDSILGHIGRLALQVLSGWDAAATTIVERGKVATYGITDGRLKSIDQYQYDTGRGPCVAALGGQIHHFNGEVIEPRWRQFAEVAADSDVYSVISFPLRLDDEVVGALNIYSRERDALRPGQREEGLLFASQAAITLANARGYIATEREVEQLREALETRTMIGQATGLLMAQDGLSSEEAFQKLVKVSRNANIKLRDLAQRYADVWQQKAKTSSKDG